MDIEHLRLLRENVERFMADVAARYGIEPARLLDIAPQVHKGARPFFGPHVHVDTLDIDPDSGATFIADLCDRQQIARVPGGYDMIVCTEVLEHTLQPFDAVDNIHAMLKPGGLVFVSTPFNFRMHGPLPDCWRFTEHGLRRLFQDFQIIELAALECEDRFLMPIHYTVVARKPVSRSEEASDADGYEPSAR